jgi:ribonuclease HI
MPWIRRKLRKETVYVKARPDGTPAVDGKGRVDIRYKPTAAAKVYRAALQNLEATGNPEDDVPIELEGVDTAADTGRIPEDAIIIYTDGACTGNPGPAGIGVVILDRGKRREISEYLGMGTNNIAELTAIERALEALDEEARSRPVVVHSDSSYSLGLLTKNWKAKANQALVARLRALAKEFANLHLVKVKGHSGVPENERADELAREAVERRD